jgi:DNA-directed RNA polymerase specialized sigma subunit
MERDFEEAEVRELVGAAVDSLPDLERLVVRLYFWEGKPLHVIGLVIGRCEARASQLKSSGLQRLAKRLRLPHPH